MRKILATACLIPLLIISVIGLAEEVSTKKISDGIEYNKIEIEKWPKGGGELSSGFIHLFRIAPDKFKLDVITARAINTTNASAQTIAQKTGAILVINGGFFTPEYESLGLIVRSGREVNKLKWTNWWHIFQLRGAKPEVITKQEYILTSDTEMAIEAGPRLLIDGAVLSALKDGKAERSAIGIFENGDIMISVTENLPLSLTEFANQLQKTGCKSVLNLDGGSSTQLYVKYKGFELNRLGLGLVANGIGVFPREINR